MRAGTTKSSRLLVGKITFGQIKCHICVSPQPVCDAILPYNARIRPCVRACVRRKTPSWYMRPVQPPLVGGGCGPGACGPKATPTNHQRWLHGPHVPGRRFSPDGRTHARTHTHTHGSVHYRVGYEQPLGKPSAEYIYYSSKILSD
jgi:hypothetical protein